MRNLIIIGIFIGLLFSPLTAIANPETYNARAGDNGTGIMNVDSPVPEKCKLIETIGEGEDAIIYINPIYISHLGTVKIPIDQHSGSTGRYILTVHMTNGDCIIYGRFTTEDNRKNAVNYINNRIMQCQCQQ